MKQLRIPAVYMRGGTSKGVFFLAEDLPSDPQARDRILMRVIGSPDRYGKHTDGMGGATSSTSKVVILSKSKRPDCDVDYLFGQVAIDQPLVDWSGNCGNLSAAVGPFAISMGLVGAPADGTATVRIWQANIRKKIVSHVPMTGGEVQELGDFQLDGVAFPAAEVRARVPRSCRRRGRGGTPAAAHVPDRQSHRRARRSRRRQDRGHADQCRQSHDLRRCRRARPQGHRAAGRHQRRQGAAGPRRSRCARWVRSRWAAPPRRRRRRPSGRTRPSSPSSPSRPATPPPTAARSRPARSTFWRASSRWACCITP